VTRYLSAAAHLRSAMLPAQVSDTDRLLPVMRAPHPVGRTYAMRVLYSTAGEIPMPAVDMDMVRRNCHAAVRQALARDAVAISLLGAVVILQPLGTLIAVLVFVVPLFAAARTKRNVSTWVPVGLSLGLLLALTALNPSPRNYCFIPVIALAMSFLIVIADLLCSVCQVRRIWTLMSNAPARMADGNVVFYDKHGIIGSGVSIRSFPITIPLDKPKDPDQPVRDVTAADLLAYVGTHLKAQGVSDGLPHGYAHHPNAATSLSEPLDFDGDSAFQHFTHGLPNLEVRQVRAAQVPEPRKVWFTSLHRLSVGYAEHPAADPHRQFGTSPVDSPVRDYTRAVTATGDGQLVASIFVSAALQGHFLQVVIRPYLIAPIDADLRSADSLANCSRAALVVTCMAMAAQQSLAVAEAIRSNLQRGTAARGEKPKVEPVKPRLLSVREEYAQTETDSLYHSEDAARLIGVMQQKVIRTTMAYIEDCNIDTGQVEAQIMQTFVQNTINGTGNIVSGGQVSQSPMTTMQGQGNSAVNTAVGPTSPQQGKGSS
jgi:hypothetical protein